MTEDPLLDPLEEAFRDLEAQIQRREARAECAAHGHQRVVEIHSVTDRFPTRTCYHCGEDLP